MATKLDYIFCDLDGTLCDIRWRQDLAQSGDWDAFHAGIPNDSPRYVVLSFLRIMAEAVDGEGDKPHLVFLTGRPDKYEPETIDWLSRQVGFEVGDDYEAILMRGREQEGSDHIIKSERIESFLAEAYGNGVEREYWLNRVLVLDDREKVVTHLRDLGYEVWHVAEGAY